MIAHGLANVDWVTVWFFVRNWNTMLSPTAAVTLEGLYVNVLFSPTLTRMSAADTEDTRASEASAKKCIVKD